MRSVKMGNKIVKKAITWAMVAMMTLSGSFSSIATMTVHAEETGTTTETTTSESTEEVTSTPEANVKVSETVNDGGTEYYVGETEVEDEDTAKAQGEQDHIVEELVIDESATKVNHYIVDAEGNYVTDEKGNNIEVKEGTVIEQIEVVEKEDGSFEEINEEDIVYVKENEDGVKELVDADTEGAAEYVEVENGDGYVDSVTINELTLTDAEGNETKQFVDDDLAALLDDDEETTTEVYTLETVYTVSVKDADGNDIEVEVKASDLDEDEKPETDAEGNVMFSVEEKTTYSFTDKKGTKTYEADSASLEVIKHDCHYFVIINGKEVEVDDDDVKKTTTYSFTDKKGTTYEAIKEGGDYFIIKNGRKVEVDCCDGDVNKTTTYSMNTKSKTTYQTTLDGTTYEVSSENVKAETRYEVIDKNGDIVMELTKEQYENRNVTSKDYAKVDDEYVVYEGEKEVARFTEDEWKVITEANVTYKKVTKMYYTANENAEYAEVSFGEKGSELMLGDTYYKLDVKLYKNTDGITYGEPTCIIDEDKKEAVVSVEYTLEDGTTGTFVRRVALADFGKSNYATVTIKYVPTYTTKEGFTFDVEVVKNTENSVTVTTTNTTTTTTDSLKMTLGMETSLTSDQIAKVIDASVNEGVQTVDENLIKALMFVRLDGIEKEENGKTHYPKSEYSGELAKGQVILLFSPNGYKVYGEIGDKTVYGNILTFVEDGTEKYISDIENAYLDNLTDDQKDLIRNAVELEVEKQIEEQKKAIAESLFGEGYTEDEFNTITWEIDQDAIDATIEDVMNNLAIRWYVLKEESDGNHIDGVVVTKEFTVEVNGEVITIPEIIPGPTPTPVDPTPVDPTPGDDTPTVTIDDAPVALAAAPVQAAPVAEEPAVLGVRRTPEATEDSYYGVLGKKRRPATGDSMAITLWAMSALGGAGTASVAGAKLLKRRKKDEK